MNVQRTLSSTMLVLSGTLMALGIIVDTYLFIPALVFLYFGHRIMYDNWKEMKE